MFTLVWSSVRCVWVCAMHAFSSQLVLSRCFFSFFFQRMNKTERTYKKNSIARTIQSNNIKFAISTLSDGHVVAVCGLFFCAVDPSHSFVSFCFWCACAIICWGIYPVKSFHGVVFMRRTSFPLFASNVPTSIWTLFPQDVLVCILSTCESSILFSYFWITLEKYDSKTFNIFLEFLALYVDWPAFMVVFV